MYYLTNIHNKIDSNTIIFAKNIFHSMKDFVNRVSFQVNQKSYLKDPESSDLGRKIICGSIDIIDEDGFEQFNFRKLANLIGSTEASIYRYFENKQKLLLYLSSWYWNWMGYKLVFSITNISSPKEQLIRAIKLITEDVKEDSSIKHINERKLHRIIISESSKVFLNKEVEIENGKGAFTEYKDFVERISAIIKRYNKDYKYPHMLVSTLIEGVHFQRFFAEHLPKLTDVIQGEDSIYEFYKEMVINTINSNE